MLDVLPKNKFAALAIFVLIVAVGVMVAMALTRIVPDTKNAGSFRFKLGGGSKKLAANPTT